MNIERRAKIASLVFRIHRMRSRFCWIMVHLLKILVQVVVRLIHSTRQSEIKNLQKAAVKFQKRVDSIKPELQTFTQLKEHRQKQLLTVRSALLEESEHLQDRAAALRSGPGSYSAPGATTVLTMAGYLQIRLADISRKTSSFSQLISKIESDTFYWDLMLWLVVPCGDSEALMGDLTEEYLLQISTLGEAGAKTWYRYQVINTLKECVWKRFERLAAIGALIDLLDRWFNK